MSELCGVKPYVLRYWEQEFTQLKPMKRRGNRRYYQHHEVLLIRRIRELLYEQGFTISGARNRLTDAGGGTPRRRRAGRRPSPAGTARRRERRRARRRGKRRQRVETSRSERSDGDAVAAQVRQELLSIRGLLGP